MLRCFLLAQDGTLTSEIQCNLNEFSHCKQKTVAHLLKAESRQRKAEDSFAIDKVFAF